MVLEINQDNFEKEVKNSDVPVIIDFFATWCGPCQMLAPVFQETSKDYDGKLKFVKVNTEENQDLSYKFQVSGIPCLIITKDGEEIDRIVGFMQKDELKKRINEILNK